MAWYGKSYSDASWIQAPPGWDTGWRTALSGISGGAPATWMALGDSTSAGQNSGDVMNNNWVEIVNNRLAYQYGRYADFYPLWTYNTRTNTNFVGSAPFSAPSGATTYEAAYGRAVELASGQNATFTTPLNGTNGITGLDYVWIDYAAGTSGNLVVDGGAQTLTTTGTGGSTFTGATVKKLSIPGLAQGPHSLAINGSAGHTTIPVGVSQYYAATGIGCVRNAYNGIRLVDHGSAAGSNTGAGQAASMPSDKIKLFQGLQFDGTATGFGFPTQPALAVIALSLNDTTYGASLQSFRSTTHRLAAAFRRGYPNCSLIFLMMSYPNATYSDVGLSGSGMVYQKFKREASDAAQSYGGVLVDIDSKWESRGVSLGFQNAADLHPTAAGYADIANAILGLVS